MKSRDGELIQDSSYLGIRRFEEYDKNPFLTGILSHVDRSSSTKVAKWTTRTGKLVNETDSSGNDVYIGIKRKVDSESYTKVYKKTLKKMMGFSEGCIKLMMYIAEKLEKQSLQIDFYLEDCMVITGLSKTTIYRGLAELLENEVIARKSQRSYIYFINPVLLFNGDRLHITESIERDQTLDIPAIDNQDINIKLQAIGSVSFEHEVINDFE